MTNNYVLVKIRHALNLDESVMLKIFGLSGHEISPATLTAMLKKEDEQGHVACSDKVLGSFLDGLIIHKRGKKENQPVFRSAVSLTNNDILKKLRIALELKEADMLKILKLGEVNLSPSELTALFRNPEHKHFKECGDQFLRYFFKGLSIYAKKRLPAGCRY
jgi:uncharacterized protein YehS (DUF1456 family)